jgi:UDPglucose 6-dehydrogenase
MDKIFKVGIIGIGFVGNALAESFYRHDIDVRTYDKCRECTDSLENLLHVDIMFLCLPTQYDYNSKSYDKSSIYDVCSYLSENNFTGATIVKSTVEPGSTQELSNSFSNLNIIHNPEFLTARTAQEDYHNQKHIVLGKTMHCNDGAYSDIIDFHALYYPWAHISKCTSLESECVKIFANNFYSIKIQFFTELFLLCGKINCNYDLIRTILIRNNWINPMHTVVPGPDGEISYGGLCFPKDTSALLEFMKLHDTPCSILDACITERNTMREDHDNCIRA